ncbi:MAG: Adenine phosphoribosyltransferase [Bacteroidetes bacterium ADurb.Bin234]|jgi:adenine phosphoribosyltransferase|nr:MAG: Adenine phosphoribosyltransferase [Bacteroidetes bacterium ADurb.Bin234]
MEEYKNLIRQLQDFPKKGILFQDINPLLSNWKALQSASTELSDRVSDIMPFVSKVLAVEARGFIMGGILATLMEAGFVPIRKKGKLPAYETLRTIDYQLEYGTDSLCLDMSLVNYNDKIVIFDDVLATGGTAEAVYNLLLQEMKQGKLAPIEKNNICFAFMLDIEFLKGKQYLLEHTGLPKENIISLMSL